LPPGNSNTVVTGQQLGLLGGPLYTTYKVLGAVKTARQLGGRAVYWLEGNDADFEEVRHLHGLDDPGELFRLTWRRKPTRGLRSGAVPVDEKLTDMLREFFRRIPSTRHTAALQDAARDAYRPGRTLMQASTTLARRLFSAFDLEFFDPAADDFRQSSRPLLLAEAEATAEGSQGNFFIVDNNIRRPVWKHKGGWRTRRNRVISLSDFPLVPNVKTRNICQDAYFHTHTYIAGPGEQRYIAELTPDYDRHGVRPAAVQPRMSVLLIDTATRRRLKRTGLTPDEIIGVAADVLVKTAFTRALPFRWDEWTRQVRRETDDYIARLADLGAGLPRRTRSAIKRTAKDLVGGVRADYKSKRRSLLDAARRVSHTISPKGTHQERVLTLFQFMNLSQGLRLVPWLYEQYDPDKRVIYVD
jgi:bacillithiol synthase